MDYIPGQQLVWFGTKERVAESEQTENAFVSEQSKIGDSLFHYVIPLRLPPPRLYMSIVARYVFCILSISSNASSAMPPIASPLEASITTHCASGVILAERY